MNNEELKKKIVEIVNETTIKVEGISFIGTAESIADALIAAGIGDVKDLKVQVDSLEITNIALQAGYDDAEKDRLYWVDKYKEAEHRTEVAERAVQILANDSLDYTYDDAMEQAEKELAEERKE